MSTFTIKSGKHLSASTPRPLWHHGFAERRGHADHSGERPMGVLPLFLLGGPGRLRRDADGGYGWRVRLSAPSMIVPPVLAFLDRSRGTPICQYLSGTPTRYLSTSAIETRTRSETVSFPSS